ncbi:MAG: hypothetical protein QG564_502 [Campylobacterota bacterium]|nr:hypothetical protein [Campylobacterota bacterium]
MYDIKPLEEEWKKYKRKKMKPWYIFIFVSLFFAVLVPVSLPYYKDSFFRSLKEMTKTKTEIQAQVQPVAKNEHNQSVVLLNGPLTMLEVYPPKEKKEEASLLETEPEAGPYDSAQEVSVLEEEVVPIQAQTSQPAPKKEIQKQKVHLNIIETTSITAYQEVEKRFYESRDVEDALFLAKSYFDQGKYQKAEYWALQTNKVNQNIEESWIIFVKSKLKLGRKNEAIRILTAYVQRTDSKQGKKLLEQIKNGSL